MKRNEKSWLLRALGTALVAVLLASAAVPVLAGADPVVGGDEPKIGVDAGGDSSGEEAPAPEGEGVPEPAPTPDPTPAPDPAPTLQGLIDQAIAASEPVVTLADDAVEGVTVPAGATLTLDLGGNKLTGKDGAAIVNKGTLAIKNGTVAGAADTAAIVCAPGSVTRIEKGVAVSGVEATGLCDVTVDGLRTICAHKAVATPAKEATCTEAGNTAYWTCETCKKVFSDEALTAETTLDKTVIPKRDTHDLQLVDEKGATCTEAGTKAHEVCTVCGALFLDGDAVTAEDLTIPATGHEKLEEVAEVAPTCTTAGTKAHFACPACGFMALDAEGATPVTAEELVIAPLPHDVVKTEAKDATCTEDGNIAYWTCKTCGKLFSDEALTAETTPGQTVIPATGHDLVPTAAKPATCTEDGNIAYWTCSVCKKTFSDEKGATEVADLTVKAGGHKLDHVAAREATEKETGLLEHWKCSVCGALFADEAATKPTTAEALTTPVKEAVPQVFTVTFVWGGTAKAVTVEVTEGGKAVAPAKAPTLEGYKFTGTWYLTRGEGGVVSDPYDFAQPVTGDLTLYAGWTRVAKEDPKDSDKKATGVKNPAIPNAGEEASAAATVLVAGAAVAAAGIALRKRAER